MRTIMVMGVLAVFSTGIMGQATPGNAGVPEPFTVVLDAGHGGHDPGNLGNGYLEKNIALNIVLEVGKELEKLPNTKVIYTRKDDSFVDLYVRGEIANKAKADLFVSVHCDSHTSNAHGAGTFVLGLHANEQNFEIAKKENSVIYLEDNYESRYAEYDINSPESVIGLTIMQEEFLDQSILLGKLMQDRFTGELNRNDRKVKQAGFIVLHQTFMPSVLVETGFLTNKEEGRFLNSESGQEKMGKAIADAIRAYKESLGSEADLGLAAQGQLPVNETASAPDSGGVQTEPADTGLPVNKEAIPPATGKPEGGTTAADKPNPTGPATSPDAVRAQTLGISFKVQLVAVSRDPDLNSAAFGRLPNLSKELYQNMYRVLYGNTRSYEDAQKLQSFAAQRGYPSAYIVAYKEGNRIPVPKALEMLDN